MKKVSFFWKKNLMKIITIITVLLVVITLISSSSISITIRNISNPKKSYFTESKEEISNGLAPRNRDNIMQTSTKINNMDLFFTDPLDDIMYGYNAYDPYGQLQEGPVYFDLDNPGTIEQIAPTESDNFIAGATYRGCDKRWLGCENGSGKIWEIDIETGEMTLVGGGGENLNSLAWDPHYEKCYGSGDDNYLYKIDIDTGEQEQIGPFGNNVEYMIGMAFDLNGILWGWDLGNDKLWTIDTSTGEATEVAPLGIDLNYAQDGDFDLETGILWLTAYSTTGFLACWDFDGEELIKIDDFQGGAQITGSIVWNVFLCPQRDIALKSIVFPESGPAGPNMKMQVTVKNQGNDTETFDAQMEIIGNQSVKMLLEEDFSGTFPPEGWETDSWEQCNSSCCHDPPCACFFPNNQVSPFDSGSITSKAVDASEYKKCSLRFYFEANTQYPQYCSFFIKFRRNETSPWKDVTPWDNPIDDIEFDFYEIGIYPFNSSEGCGEALQIKWEFIGNYYNCVCLDTIYLEAFDYYIEYAEVVEDITLDPGEKKQIEFPPWTPTQWQDPEYENTWVDYLVDASTMLDGDQNPGNDNKYKFIDLYFGFFHDVGVKNVSCPESGPAQTFPVTGHVKNFGQYDESDFKTYVEIAELDTSNPVELLTEEFSDSTFPPDGWTRTHNNWMYSSTSYAGGSTGEARFYYYPSSTDIFRLATPAIDTGEYDAIKIEFKHYLDHYISPYTVKLETSEDGLNWDVLWKTEPTEDIGPESINILTDKNIGSNTYISWTFEGNSYNINNWYVDDINIVGYYLLEPEYVDNRIISTIEPGEELEVIFSDWTPEFLAEELTDKKIYVVKAWTSLEEPEDKNPDNDLFEKFITLDFFHDVGIKNIISPSNPSISFIKSKIFAPPLPEMYIQPGNEDIDVFIENNGTFPELDLTCYAEIWDFFTNGNDSLVYYDEITDIDLEEPLGGTKLLNFDDFTFVDESVYGLYVDLPHKIDDFLENNHEELIIGVDDSPPFSWIEEIYPPEPDGENGWYVSDVTITICAEDPEIQPGIPGSGILGIWVGFNDDSSQFFPGDCITFKIDTDGDDILIEYCAVDNVGNTEPKRTIPPIDMDQTPPDVLLSYAITGGNKYTGWEFTFTATATDAMSGMDRVEFYLNEELQDIINGSGPTYSWTVIYFPLPKAVFIAKAFDKAGLSKFDKIIDPLARSHSRFKSDQIFNKIRFFQYIINLLLLRMFERFQIIQMIQR